MALRNGFTLAITRVSWRSCPSRSILATTPEPWRLGAKPREESVCATTFSVELNIATIAVFVRYPQVTSSVSGLNTATRSDRAIRDHSAALWCSTDLSVGGVRESLRPNCHWSRCESVPTTTGGDPRRAPPRPCERALLTPVLACSSAFDGSSDKRATGLVRLERALGSLPRRTSGGACALRLILFASHLKDNTRLPVGWCRGRVVGPPLECRWKTM